MLEKAGGFEGHTYTFPMMNRDRVHVHQLNKSYTIPMMNRDRFHTFINNIRVTIFCNHKLYPILFSTIILYSRLYRLFVTFILINYFFFITHNLSNQNCDKVMTQKNMVLYFLIR